MNSHPGSRAMQAAGAVARQAEGEAGPTRILIVDPYGHSRDGLSLALLGRLCHVETAATSWEAIKKIKERPFDIAVVDAELPSTHGLAMTGWDVARILRAFNPALAIVVVTAEKGPDAQRQADRLGISRLLEKPISPRELRTILQTLEPGSVGGRRGAGG